MIYGCPYNIIWATFVSILGFQELSEAAGRTRCNA